MQSPDPRCLPVDLPAPAPRGGHGAILRLVTLLALVLTTPTGTPRAAIAEASGGLSTAEFLELPELFQLSVVTGSLAMLEHWAEAEIDAGGEACHRRWTVPEDVAALVAIHVRREPASAERPFAETLMAALAARCAQL